MLTKRSRRANSDCWSGVSCLAKALEWRYVVNVFRSISLRNRGSRLAAVRTLAIEFGVVLFMAPLLAL